MPSQQQQHSTKHSHNPDVVFFHDSLGHAINEGIMSKQGLTTRKIVSYTLEDVEHNIRDLRSQPKAIVIHSGTNDIKNGVSAEEIIDRYQHIVRDLKNKFRDTEVILSSIAPREDNDWGQRQVEYINAAVNRKLGDNVTFVCNRDLWGRGVKKRDGVHLTEAGTSILASHIKAGITQVLEV